jgi:hypothetical protein
MVDLFSAERKVSTKSGQHHIVVFGGGIVLLFLLPVLAAIVPPILFIIAICSGACYIVKSCHGDGRPSAPPVITDRREIH